MKRNDRSVTRRGLLRLAADATTLGLTACGRAEAPSADAAIPEVTGPACDLAAGIVTLSNGVEMPLTGIGTYALSPDEAAESVYWCIEAGGRLIDTAAAYNNEEGVGCGLCARQCPLAVIEMRDGHPVWTKPARTVCLGCLHHCRTNAIAYGKHTKGHGQYHNQHL